MKREAHVDIGGSILLGRRNSKCLVCSRGSEETAEATADGMRGQVISNARRM